MTRTTFILALDTDRYAVVYRGYSGGTLDYRSVYNPMQATRYNTQVEAENACFKLSPYTTEIFTVKILEYSYTVKDI